MPVVPLPQDVITPGYQSYQFKASGHRYRQTRYLIRRDLGVPIPFEERDYIIAHSVGLRARDHFLKSLNIEQDTFP